MLFLAYFVIRGRKQLGKSSELVPIKFKIHKYPSFSYFITFLDSFFFFFFFKFIAKIIKLDVLTSHLIRTGVSISAVTNENFTWAYRVVINGAHVWITKNS